MSKILQLISGPRNISTALMYSFGNRDDFDVVDEPFYAYYLNKYKIEYHPGTKDIIQSMSVDANEVISMIMAKEENEKYFFVKNMAHHLAGFDYAYSYQVKNVFLIRDPSQLINSFSKVIENPTGLDIGVQREYELYEEFFHKGEHKPVVLDSGEILKNPDKVLKELCIRLDIPFSNKMLSWPPGPRKEDGVWAKYWYGNVHKSRGFKKQPKSAEPLIERFRDLYEEVYPFYEKLFKVSIKA